MAKENNSICPEYNEEYKELRTFSTDDLIDPLRTACKVLKKIEYKEDEKYSDYVERLRETVRGLLGLKAVQLQFKEKRPSNELNWNFWTNTDNLNNYFLYDDSGRNYQIKSIDKGSQFLLLKVEDYDDECKFIMRDGKLISYTSYYLQRIDMGDLDIEKIKMIKKLIPDEVEEKIIPSLSISYERARYIPRRKIISDGKNTAREGTIIKTRSDHPSTRILENDCYYVEISKMYEF